MISALGPPSSMRKLLFLSLSLLLPAPRAFAAAPYQVVDLNTRPSGPISSSPYFFGATSSAAFFMTGSSYSDRTPILHRTDGTAAGTFPLLTLRFAGSYF